MRIEKKENANNKMSDSSSSTYDVGISCDDSQDCPKDMWCREKNGRKRCQRTVNPDTSLKIGLVILGIVIFFVILVLMFTIFTNVTDKSTNATNPSKISSWTGRWGRSPTTTFSSP